MFPFNFGGFDITDFSTNSNQVRLLSHYFDI